MASSLSLLLLLCLQAFALTPDPSGASKIGNGQHQSSIGSQCLSSLDCGANGNIACCAFLPQTGGATIGICSGCGATTQQGKQGCGFGDANQTLAGDAQICPASSFAGGVLPRTITTQRRSAKWEQRKAVQKFEILNQRQGAVLPDPTLDSGAGNGQNKQFITGRCVSSKDCGANQSDLSNVCCASVADQSTGQTVGVCSGAAVGNAAPKQGCGFGDGLANSGASAVAAVAVGSRPGAEASAAASVAVASSAAVAPAAGGAILPDPSLDAGRGNQQNKQFVTGACLNAKDCGASQSDLANVCCASVMSGGQAVGVCSGSAVGNAAPKMGCGFGDGKANSAA